ncbi:MAG: hypothetical protein OXU36_15400 [Candidatus Poribacteria bacterium]|nr:hypothetical protein [Candidatus Poribacteria bacterium]
MNAIKHSPGMNAVWHSPGIHALGHGINGMKPVWASPGYECYRAFTASYKKTECP